MYDVFIISPVRNIDSKTRDSIAEHVQRLEQNGSKVYWPYRDTLQVDNEVNICTNNMNAMAYTKDVHIWYTPESIGSVFDLGMAWAFGKRVKIINTDAVERENHKSFVNLLLDWNVT